MSVLDLAIPVLTAIAAAAVLLPSTALGLLAIASLKRSAAVAPARGEPLRLAILIAAHNEERELAPTLATIASRGDDHVTIHVVADNCSDDTAAVASARGACVHVREDRTRPGKAAALNWLATQVLREEPDSVAFVIIDADSHPDPGFFAALRSMLASGAIAIQGVNLVRPTSAPLTRLRALAFHMRCELRPLAFEALGISVGLHGNGMCFRRALVESYRWDERSVVEDGELHLRLVADGMRVRLARGAIVRSSMPGRFAGAAGQAIRWERGKCDLIRPGLRLIGAGLASRRPASAWIGYDVLIPPLSFLVALSTGVAAAGAATGHAAFVVIGAASLVGCAVYLIRGLTLARFGLRTIARTAPWAVPYIFWKVAIFAGAIAGSGRGRWAQARPSFVQLGPAAKRSEGDL